ncbi:MAG TPA: adenylate/guanylate cyclase domain-containing protein, partial [Aggregatilineales bacterium]|nr:adenylate/guanylate cyclase domain-containing protein [Aggregatilineales bacterium]
MDNSLSTFIPMDRRQALARNETLPEKTYGSALFADISGFTPLTEALTRALGPRHGAEELSRQLNRVYDTLIAEIDRYGGTVIGFSGDAITCWFDGNGRAADDPTTPLRAVACGLSMQEAMSAYTAVKLPAGDVISLAMKATVATGAAHRFLVGDPQIQLLDAIGGDTLARMADAEHLATRGEVLIDEATAAVLKDRVAISEWRTLEEKNERCAVVQKLLEDVVPTPWSPLAAPLSDEQERPWLLRVVYEELTGGLGEFLTELRPTVSIFIRFTGINYDLDENAPSRLDAYIAWVQDVLADYDGILVDLTIGDKGSYLYASFGAPTAHEDDPRRAGLAALALRTPPTELNYIQPVQIGISQGTMRTGLFGGDTRRTYGILGDEVNLAARLMQHAQPGEILVSGRVQKAIAHAFDLEPLAPVIVKGKSEPVPLARLLRRTHATTESNIFAGTLIGRDEELALLSAFIEPIFEKRFGGVATVYGEAGMGKSRLVYELRRQLAQSHHFNWFSCPAEQLLRQSLHPFKYFLRQYFEQDSANSEEENKAAFEAMFGGLSAALRGAGEDELCAELERKRPFLGALVDLHWQGSSYEEMP